MRLNAIIRNSSTALPPGTDVSMTRGEDRSFEVWVRGLEAGRSLVQLVDTGKANVSDGDAEAYYQKIVTATSDIATVGRITDNGAATRIAKATIAFAATDSTDWPDKLLRQMWAVLDNGERKCCFAAAILTEGAIPETLPGDEAVVARVLVTAPAIAAYGLQGAPCTAVAEEQDGTPITGRVKRWSVSTSPDIASIDASSGILTVLADGVFDVVCTVGGVSGEAVVTVAISTTPASIDPLAPITVAEGVTSAAPTVVVRNAGGGIIGSPTLSFAIVPDTTHATCNPATGAVTGVAAGSCTLRVTAGSVTADAAVTVSLPTELEFLRANLGGDANLRAIYSVGDNAALAIINTDELNQLHDLRGSTGFAPSWTKGPPPGDPGLGVTTGLQVLNPSNPATRVIKLGGAARGMATPYHDALNQSKAKCLVVIGTINPAFGSTYDIVLWWQGDGSGGAHQIDYLGDTYDSSKAGMIRYQHFDDPSVSNYLANTNAFRRCGPKRRLFVVSKDNGYLHLDSPPVAVDDDAVWASTAIPAIQNLPGSLFVPSDGYYPNTGPVQGEFRAILALGSAPTPTQEAALARWARDYHSAIAGTDIMVVADGDSRTQGGAASDFRKGWFDLTMARTGWELVDDSNEGMGGSYIGVDIDSFQSSAMRRAPHLIAAFNASPATKKLVTLWPGTNDISYHTTLTAADLETRLWALVDRYVAGVPGIKVIVGTIIPDAMHTTGAQQTIRTTLNAAIRANAASHGATVWDPCALAAFDAQADTSNTTYYLDGTHQTDAGNVLLADSWEPIAKGLLGIP